jgi:hypothetical protein
MMRYESSRTLIARSCMEPLAVSRKPLALPDALVYELYGLTEEEIRITEEGPT